MTAQAANQVAERLAVGVRRSVVRISGANLCQAARWFQSRLGEPELRHTGGLGDLQVVQAEAGRQQLAEGERFITLESVAFVAPTPDLAFSLQRLRRHGISIALDSPGYRWTP